jgi:antitoxin (DNA-binding transcriptional repressor) of toxin-antitoxin stability system
MIRVNIHEAKAGLSALIEEASKGETVTICRRNQPVAEIRALRARKVSVRACGLEEGRLVIEPSFFEPLPASLLEAFEGHEEASEVHDSRPPSPTRGAP